MRKVSKRAAAHRPRRVLELRVDAPQGRAHRQQHERVGEQREHQPGAREAVDRGQPSRPRARRRASRRARARRRTGRRRRRWGSPAAACRGSPTGARRQVGADRQPADRHRDRDRGGGDRGGEPDASAPSISALRRVERRFERRSEVAERRRPPGRRPAEDGGADDEPGEQQRAGGRRSRAPSAARRAPGSVGRGALHAYSAPPSCISSIVAWVSAMSERSPGGAGSRSSGSSSDGSSFASTRRAGTPSSSR